MIQLHPETQRLLKEQHECLAETRRRLRAAIEATDKHIDVVLRILNERGDQKDLTHVTRKFVRACRELGEVVDEYMQKYVVEKKAPNTAATPLREAGKPPPDDGGNAA